MKSQFKKELSKIKKWISSNLILLMNLIFIILLILTFFVNRYSFIWLIVESVSFVILETLKGILRVNKNKLPVIDKDLTFKSDDGSIKIMKCDLEKALIYLNMVENYIKENNLR